MRSRGLQTRPRHRLANRIAVATAAIWLCGSSLSAAIPLPILGLAALWVGDQIVSYALGKAIDRARGVDLESQLKTLEGELEARIRSQGAKADADLRKQLDVARSERRMIQKLLAGRPTRQELDRYRARVTADLEAIFELLSQHGERLTELEQQVAELETKLAQLFDLEQPAAPPRRPSPAVPRLLGGEEVRWNLAGVTYSGTVRLRGTEGTVDVVFHHPMLGCRLVVRQDLTLRQGPEDLFLEGWNPRLVATGMPFRYHPDTFRLSESPTGELMIVEVCDAVGCGKATDPPPPDCQHHHSGH